MLEHNEQALVGSNFDLLLEMLPGVTGELGKTFTKDRLSLSSVISLVGRKSSVITSLSIFIILSAPSSLSEEVTGGERNAVLRDLSSSFVISSVDSSAQET